MKNFIFFFCFIFILSLQGQKLYKFPENFNPYYNFNPDDYFKKFMQLPKMQGQPPEIGLFNRHHIYNEQGDFDANRVYMDWDEVEVYLLKILHKLFPSNAKTKTVDLFISRSLSANAFASRSGKIFFNLGMLCNAENEAFLAAVIAHEVGHCLLNHSARKLDEFGPTLNNKNMMGALQMSRRMELQADSFAIEALLNAGINPEPLKLYHEENDVADMAQQNSRSYKNMLKASNLSADQIKERRKQVYDPLSTHPSAIERYAYIKKSLEGCEKCGSDFFVDSLFFLRLRKTAREERKKIAFEGSMLDRCMSYSFVDYLYEPKSAKNLYMLLEATRRLLYIKPELATKGFLTEYVGDDDLYYYNKSVLHKPQFLFDSYKEFTDLNNHPFIKNEKKPFETYEQAFFYFTDQALKMKLNEANFSRALYYSGLNKPDSVKSYLEKYISGGPGLYTEYANRLLKKEKVMPSQTKTLVVYNNTHTYSGFSYDYYLSLKKKADNGTVKERLVKDSTKTDLVMVSELFGARPRYLNEIQILMNSVFRLYNEDDIEACKKIRLTSHFAGEDKEIQPANKKQLMVYAPELYSWFKEHNYSRLFLVDVIYQYPKHEGAEESFNNYTGYYIDVNQERPYFRDAARSGFKTKQKEKEIHNELYSFLYE